MNCTLTDEQLVQLVAEYLRYSLQSSVDVTSKQVDYAFTCKINRHEHGDEHEQRVDFASERTGSEQVRG